MASTVADDAQPWMVSPAVDLALLVCVTLTTLGPWVASDLLHVPGYYVLVAVAVVNGPHLISTWTRVYLPRRERWRRPIHYWVVPGVLALVALLFNSTQGVLGAATPWWGPVLLRSTIFYYASWHFVAQSWGILKIYQRKQGAVGTVEGYLEKALIFLPALFCLARRIYTGPRVLFGVEVFYVKPPALFVNGLGALIAVVALIYVVRIARRPPWLRATYLAMNFVGFAMPYLVIKDGTSAFAAAALWHAVQYMAIVWTYNRRRYAGAHDPDAPLLSYVSQPGAGRALAYVGLIAVCAAGVYTVAFAIARVAHVPFEDFAMTVWTGLTLGHYYLDGKIWKWKQYDLRALA
jgi:hypothetical protein